MDTDFELSRAHLGQQWTPLTELQDFTVFLDTLEFRGLIGAKQSIFDQNKSLDGTCWYLDSHDKRHDCRYHACFASNTDYVSITIRGSIPGSSKEPEPGPLQAKFAPSDFVNSTYPVPFSFLGDYIFKTISAAAAGLEPFKKGLVVVCGETASGKSNVARDLVYRILEGKTKRAKRRPHLITFEDPIEKRYYDADLKLLSEQAEVDYTPRAKDQDCLTPKAFFESALRQTPALAFVGETRDPGSWKDVIEFGGTGHLVLTTTHAGSVVDCFMKILDATESLSSAPKRALISSRVLAIIHLRPFTLELKDGSYCELIFPSLYVRTERSMAEFTSNGFAGVLPHGMVDLTSGSQAKGNQRGTFGSKAYCDHLRRNWRVKGGLLARTGRSAKTRRPYVYAGGPLPHISSPSDQFVWTPIYQAAVESDFFGI